MAHLVAHGSGQSLTGEFFLGSGEDTVTTSRLFEEIYRSAFWRTTARFGEARRRLKATAALAADWDTYGAEPPNDTARAIAARALNELEAEALPPTRLMPSSEGGVAISFIEGDNRAEIEIYNTGEIAVATYTSDSEPVVWELDGSAPAWKQAIHNIRVRLAD